VLGVALVSRLTMSEHASLVGLLRTATYMIKLVLRSKDCACTEGFHCRSNIFAHIVVD